MSHHRRPVGLAIIGCGNISDQYLSNLVRFPDVSVVACADLDVERAAAQAAKYGIDRSGDPADVLALAEVELIVNLTIPAAHAAVAQAAIRAGKHVYGEKPFARSVAEARAVLDAAAVGGVEVGNAPDTFLGAGLQTARRLFDEGRIGRPISARAGFGYPGPDLWHPNPDFLFAEGGGPLLDMGPYYLTALVQLLGPVRRVSGFGRRARDRRVIGSGPRAGEMFDVLVDTQVSALLEFERGPVATATFTFDSPVEFRELEVVGTRGVLKLPDPNRFDGSVYLVARDDDPSGTDDALPTDDWTEVPAEGSTEGRGIGVLDMARALRNGGRPRAAAPLALHVLDVMESLAESTATHRTVTVESTCDIADPLPADWSPFRAL